MPQTDAQAISSGKIIFVVKARETLKQIKWRFVLTFSGENCPRQRHCCSARVMAGILPVDS